MPPKAPDGRGERNHQADQDHESHRRRIAAESTDQRAGTGRGAIAEGSHHRGGAR